MTYNYKLFKKRFVIICQIYVVLTHMKNEDAQYRPIAIRRRRPEIPNATGEAMP